MISCFKFKTKIARKLYTYTIYVYTCFETYFVALFLFIKKVSVLHYFSRKLQGGSLHSKRLLCEHYQEFANEKITVYDNLPLFAAKVTHSQPKNCQTKCMRTKESAMQKISQKQKKKNKKQQQNARDSLNLEW